MSILWVMWSANRFSIYGERTGRATDRYISLQTNLVISERALLDLLVIGVSAA
jgi:hypothetical protein